MKKSIIPVIIILLLFTNCKKEEKTSTDSQEKIMINPEMQIQYAIQDYILTYAKKENVGKSWKEMKDMDSSEYFWLSIGNKVKVLQETNANGFDSYLFELPDGTQYWVEKEYLTHKFMIINANDTATFSQPDQDYKGKLKLQTGDFGIVKEEKNGFFLVEFKAYQPFKEGADPKYVGEVWINSGYTNDVNAAKEAYYLYLAKYYDLQKNDLTKAVENLNKGLEINNGSPTDITHVLQEYLADLAPL
ncbi:MAG: hypothetical protein MJB14_11725 [Spirochaetes bacterium]|nr:hypothetical protein [Spirochaetota bacterium]